MMMIWAKFLLITLFLEVLTPQAQGTLQKTYRPREKYPKRPPGVAYNNKRMPEDCEVCRVVSEEIENILNKQEEEPVNEEEKKMKKRENRRKGGKKAKKENKIAVVMDSVCDNMKDFIPQDDPSKFRYVSKKVLTDTVTLTMATSDSQKSEKLEKEFNTYIHPETARLEIQCKAFLNGHSKEVEEWHGLTDRNESLTLTKYLCEEKFLKNNKKFAKCLDMEKANDKLWSKTFENLAVFQRAADEF